MTFNTSSLQKLAKKIKYWGNLLGFQKLNITDIDLGNYVHQFYNWLSNQFHGEMNYMSRNVLKRMYPEKLLPGTKRIISVCMHYPVNIHEARHLLKCPDTGYISQHALTQDYHTAKLLLEKLAKLIQLTVANSQYKVFVDSAPVLEKAFAVKSGIGWFGKHSIVISRDLGSWFFLGEIYTNIPLPVDQLVSNKHCGLCTNCIDICPTNAIIAYQLDARRCIAYHTIESHSSIPVAIRRLMGNRIYGCDDCQLCCPFNQKNYFTASLFSSTKICTNLKARKLTTLFTWNENEFYKNTEGSVIQRLGYIRWLRNIAVALGNAPYSQDNITVLTQRMTHNSEQVREHTSWALEEQIIKKKTLVI